MDGDGKSAGDQNAEEKAVDNVPEIFPSSEPTNHDAAQVGSVPPPPSVPEIVPSDEPLPPEHVAVDKHVSTAAAERPGMPSPTLGNEFSDSPGEMSPERGYPEETVPSYARARGQDGSIRVPSNRSGSGVMPGAVAVPGPGAGTGTAHADQNEEMTSSEPVLSAELVDDAELRQQMLADARERIMSEAVQAEPLPLRENAARKFWICLGIALVLLIVIGAVLGTQIRKPTKAPTQSPTLAPTVSLSPSAVPSQTPSSTPTRELAWRQVGQVIEGDQEGYHYFGMSVDISYDGTAVAVGSMPDNDAQSYAEVYQLDEVSESWTPLGNKVIRLGESGKAERVNSIFLSNDQLVLTLFVERFRLENAKTSGSTKWIGLVHIYTLRDGNWVLNQALTGLNISNYGSAIPVDEIREVSVSPDGTHLVAVLIATNSSENVVRAYRASGSTYHYFGGPLYETEIGTTSFYVRSVAISRKGNVVAIGASGHVTVFHYGRNGWIKPGSSLTSNSPFATDSFGGHVTVSGDGSTVAVVDAESFSNAGSVTVFRSFGVGEWRQIGGVIVGDLNSGQTVGNGGHVTLSDDGDIVGVDGKVGTFNPGSRFKTFRFGGQDWEELNPVEDFNTDEYPCTVSGDGMSLCCGSPYDLSYGEDNGLVTVYQFSRNPPPSPPTREPATLEQGCWTKLLVHVDDDMWRFGANVVIAGDTIVATGRASYLWSAYVFTRSEMTWEQQPNSLPVGGSIAIDGDTIVIGKERDSTYVFTRSGSTWEQQAKLFPDDGAHYSFGCSVSIEEDVVVVGAKRDNNTGSAYVFTRSGETWQQQAKLLPVDGADGGGFGSIVAVSHNTIVIGSPGDDDNGSTSGSAFVFTEVDATWELQAKLLPGDGAARDTFGASLSIDGKTIVVGSPGDDDNGSISGSAFVFTQVGATWELQAKLLPGDGTAGDTFGESVAIDGDVIAVGSPRNDGNGRDSGSAYVFVRSATTWKQKAKLLPEHGEEFDGFGSSIAVEGDIIVVGNPGDSTNGSSTGSVYVGDICEEPQ